MKITILNGEPAPGGGAIDRHGEGLRRLGEGAHEITEHRLRDLTVRGCTGCWGCWVKTPGRCIHRDAMDDLLPRIIAADLLLMASPLVMGFVSALLKNACDRMIPLLHPYVEIVRGECHHRARYDRYPRLGVLVAPGDGDGPEDAALCFDIYRRFALNFKSDLAVAATTAASPEEVYHAIARL